MLRDAIDFVSLLDRHAMIVIALAAAALGGSAATAEAQQPLRIIAFGAHPDDCDIRAGGTAAKWAALGHKVRFVAVTNGDAGHQSEGGGALAKRRRAEAEEAGRRIGIDKLEGIISRHDLARQLLPQILHEQGIIDDDPFQVLDRDGVGKLMRFAAELGRRTRPDLKLGICGEHGGEPASVAFCDQLGMNYVSCSPFRVPIARLAAAQSALTNRGTMDRTRAAL